MNTVVYGWERLPTDDGPDRCHSILLACQHSSVSIQHDSCEFDTTQHYNVLGKRRILHPKNIQCLCNQLNRENTDMGDAYLSSPILPLDSVWVPCSWQYGKLKHTAWCGATQCMIGTNRYSHNDAGRTALKPRGFLQALRMTCYSKGCIVTHTASPAS